VLIAISDECIRDDSSNEDWIRDDVEDMTALVRMGIGDDGSNIDDGGISDD
jgi:hypothetical protein